MQKCSNRGYIVGKIGVIIEKQTGQFDLIGWDIQVPMIVPFDPIAQQEVKDCFHTILHMVL